MTVGKRDWHWSDTGCVCSCYRHHPSPSWRSRTTVHASRAPATPTLPYLCTCLACADRTPQPVDKPPDFCSSESSSPTSLSTTASSGGAHPKASPRTLCCLARRAAPVRLPTSCCCLEVVRVCDAARRSAASSASRHCWALARSECSGPASASCENGHVVTQARTRADARQVFFYSSSSSPTLAPLRRQKMAGPSQAIELRSSSPSSACSTPS